MPPAVGAHGGIAHAHRAGLEAGGGVARGPSGLVGGAGQPAERPGRPPLWHPRPGPGAGGRPRLVREDVSRLAESSIPERYV